MAIKELFVMMMDDRDVCVCDDDENRRPNN